MNAAIAFSDTDMERIARDMLQALIHDKDTGDEGPPRLLFLDPSDLESPESSTATSPESAGKDLYMVRITLAFKGYALPWAAFVSDTWIVTLPLEEVRPDSSPREMFLAGDPRASEAVVVILATADGRVCMAQCSYVETPERREWQEPEYVGDGAVHGGRVAEQMRRAFECDLPPACDLSP